MLKTVVVLHILLETVIKKIQDSLKKKKKKKKKKHTQTDHKL